MTVALHRVPPPGPSLVWFYVGLLTTAVGLGACFAAQYKFFQLYDALTNEGSSIQAVLWLVGIAMFYPGFLLTLMHYTRAQRAVLEGCMWLTALASLPMAGLMIITPNPSFAEVSFDIGVMVCAIAGGAGFYAVRRSEVEEAKQIGKVFACDEDALACADLECVASPLQSPCSGRVTYDVLDLDAHLRRVNLALWCVVMAIPSLNLILRTTNDPGADVRTALLCVSVSAFLGVVFCTLRMACRKHPCPQAARSVAFKHSLQHMAVGAALHLMLTCTVLTIPHVVPPSQGDSAGRDFNNVHAIKSWLGSMFVVSTCFVVHGSAACIHRYMFGVRFTGLF